MLETYIKDHSEKAAGIILIGSYLPDLFGDQSNAFPVPVLTVVGELDGMTISYVYRSVKSRKVFSIKMSLFTLPREYKESMAAEASLGEENR